ncbi:hypothetical protein [Bacillus infantis]|uniref:hypothetical protein n=1 Tax=Bacillus infantis TaxID=324767 RepID=UPI003CF6EED6
MKVSKKSSMNSNLSKKEEVLAKKLISVWKDKEFVLGIICTLKNDEEVQMMIDYIDSDGEKTPSELTTKALFIAKDRMNEENGNIIMDDFFDDLKKIAKEIGK